ncbi:MAG: LysR substrate-binding domain-containing protein [Synechococcaceae cyanobacterium]|nr:LysR substrate-binding domain-containing protein [Synechococcaceae cyanobacterium]
MNLDQLRVFLAVARHQHFSRAADELYITQPAVSAAVAKLENHYGVRLFHRLGRRVEITDVGRFLLTEGQGLLERVELLERGLHDFNTLKRGVLNLGASLTVGNYWLPSRLKAFWDQHPDVELRCSLANAEQVLEGMARGQYDLGFLTGWPDGDQAPERDGLLAAEVVGQERLLVVVGREHPWFGREALQPRQLGESAWVMREKGSGAQSLLERVLAEVDVAVTALPVALVLTSSEMVKAVVLQGGGAAALPEPMLRQELELGLLWPMSIQGSSRHRQPIWMVQHRQRYRSRLLRAFETMILTSGGEPAATPTTLTSPSATPAPAMTANSSGAGDPAAQKLPGARSALSNPQTPDRRPARAPLS